MERAPVAATRSMVALLLIAALSAAADEPTKELGPVVGVDLGTTCALSRFGTPHGIRAIAADIAVDCAL